MPTLQVQPVTFTNNTINTDSEASHEGRFHLRLLASLFTEREKGGLELSSILPIRAQSQWGLTNQRTNTELIDTRLSEYTNKRYKYNTQHTHKIGIATCH